MEIDDVASLVALTDLPGVGDKRALALFQEFETWAELQSSPLTAFETFHYIDADTHRQLQNLDQTVEDYRERFDRYEANGIDIIGIADERYPAPLQRHHAPLVLFAKGNVSRMSDPAVSVSGSRKTDENGQSWIRSVSRDLADEGYTIVSGGARGTDTAAHEGALANTGATIVVLGTGVDTPYPEENADLFSDIVDAGGLLLSHRPPEAGPVRHAFLDRNETLSALTPGTLIVATDGTGGTMAQYEIALDQNRHVFVPASDQGVRPNAGLPELRQDESTTVVSSANDVVDALSQAPPLETSGSLSEELGVSADAQSQLADWE